MKRSWILRIFCSVLLLLLPLTAAAQGVHSLTIRCRSGRTAVARVEFRLYRVGGLNDEGALTLDEAFGGDTLNKKFSDWDTLATALAKLAKDKTALAVQKSDSVGNAAFTDLEPGLYLVTAQDGSKTYEIQPFLAALPGRDPATGEDKLDLEVYPKLSKTPDSTKPTEKPGKLPQTGQNWLPIPALILFGLGIGCGSLFAGKKGRRAGILLAAVCLTGAAVFTLSNLRESTESGNQVQNALSELLPVVYANATQPEKSNAASSETDGTEIPLEVPEMPVRDIDGTDYIGYLEIPSLELTLPIQSQWSYAGLRVAPGRFTGNVYSKDLVLCTHNYPQHFGRIGSLNIGDSVNFTDMDGNVHSYRVAALETMAPEDVDGMLSGDWDLTLFTCTLGGKSRVTVRCTEN